MTKKAVAALALAGLGLAGLAGTNEVSRYQTIIDRKMFGPEPEGFDADKRPSEVASTRGSAAAEKELTKEQEKLQSAVHFSVINVDHDGKPIVGFTDNSDPKLPRHYYLRAGESQDGWTVKEADAEHATMTIVNAEGVELEMKLGDNSAGEKGGKGGAPKANGRRGLMNAGGSLRERRLQRLQAREAEAKKQAEVDAAAKAQREAAAAEEKAQREAERQEMRQSLQALQEELRKQRDAKPKDKPPEDGNGGNNAE